MQLGRLQKIEKDLKRLGIQVIAVSPDLPEKLKQSVEKHALEYTLVSDSKAAAAQAYGIAYKVDDRTLEQFHQYGIDLQAASGETHHLLPVPAAFLIDENGIVRFTYANPDYKVRVDEERLLKEAKTVAERKGK